MAASFDIEISVGSFLHAEVGGRILSTRSQAINPDSLPRVWGLGKKKKASPCRRWAYAETERQVPTGGLAIGTPTETQPISYARHYVSHFMISTNLCTFLGISVPY